MTDTFKLSLLKGMLSSNTEGYNDLSDDTLNYYLFIAGQKILRCAYPYDDNVEKVPYKYATLQCEIAAYLINKRGAEGEVAHSENGISRTYENADVPKSMLSDIVPHVGVL